MTDSIPVQNNALKIVKKSSNQLLKARLRALISRLGISEADFYKNHLSISRQYWYLISYGFVDCPPDLKVKISQALQTDSSVIWKEVRT